MSYFSCSYELIITLRSHELAQSGLDHEVWRHIDQKNFLLRFTPSPGIAGRSKSSSFITRGSINMYTLLGIGIYSRMPKFGMQTAG